MSEHKTLLYGVDDKPPVATSIALGFQYVLLNISGMMLTPIIIGNACGLSIEQIEYFIFASILVSALTTVIQVRRVGKIGSGYMMILGPSGAFIACSISAIQVGGLPLLGTMTILSAPLETIVAYLIRYVRKIFTPALGGTVIMLVAMLLIPLSFSMWSGESGDSLFCSPAYFFSGLTPVLIIFGSYLSDRKWVRLWSAIFGVAAGILVAYFFGITDFSQLGQYSYFALPRSGFPGLEFHLSWRHFPLFITFLMATLTSTIETFGDTVALQTVSERNFSKINYDRIQGGMYVDTVGSILGGAAGVTANTTYSTIMPVIQLTRVSARVIGYYAAAIMTVIAFLPKFAYFFLSIPSPVMGGMSVALTAILFSEGFKVAASAELSTENGIVIGAGMTMGLLASLGIFFPNLFPEQFRFLASDVITMGGLTALILNIIFVYKIRKTESVTLAADLAKLPDLKDKIDSFQDRMRVSEKQKFALQLACEEVFAFFCQQNPDRSDIHFRWKHFPDYILTEIATTGTMQQIDDIPDRDRLTKLSEEEMNKLGLLLLSKISSHIEHIQITGKHYIQFRI